MADTTARFLEAANDPRIARLAGDGRPAIVFDRTGTAVVWANAAGAAYLGTEDVSALLALRFPAAAPFARRIAALSGQLSAGQELTERIALPKGLLPHPVICRASRAILNNDRTVVLLVVDGTGRTSDEEAGARYQRMLDAFKAGSIPADTIPVVQEPEPAPAPAETDPEVSLAEAVQVETPQAEPAESDLNLEISDPIPQPDDTAAGAEVSTSAPMTADIAPESESTADDDASIQQGHPDESVGTIELVAVCPDPESSPALIADMDVSEASEPEKPTESAPSAGFTPPTHGRSVRFVFELDADFGFTFLSEEFAGVVGPRTADVVGRSWADVAAEFDLDPLGRVTATIRRRDTFTSITVDWPIEDAAARVPVDLTGMPVFTRDRSFRGYRGFGIAKSGAMFSVPARLRDEELLSAEAAPALVQNTTMVFDTSEPAPPTAPSKADVIEEGLGTAWPEADAAFAAPVEPAPAMAAPEAELRQPPAAPDIALLAAFADYLAVADAPALYEDAELDVILGENLEDPTPTADDVSESELGSEWSAGSGGAPVPPEVPPAPQEAPERETPSGEPATPAETPPAPGPGYPAPAPGEAPDSPRPLPDEEPAGMPDEGPDDVPPEFPGHLPADVPADMPDEAPGLLPDEIETPAAIESARRDTGTQAPNEASRPHVADALDDVAWREPQPRGEVIQSPIIARTIPHQEFSEEETARRQLSRPEREAFQKIAEALGARYEDGGPAAPAPFQLGGMQFTTPDTEGREPARTISPSGVAPGLSFDAGLLDKLPLAIAILKDGEAVTVNRAFLDLAGFSDYQALQDAGGFAEAFAGSALPRDSSLPAIRRRDGVEVPVSARLHSIPWNGGIASLLTVQETATTTGRDRAAAAEERVEELEAILDTATDGVLVLDIKGTVLGANRSAEALFGMERSSMVGDPLILLLAPESHRNALDYLDGLSRNGLSSVLNDGREVIGRVQTGGLVPLFMTIGRISASKFCAVLRDITQWKRAEEELTNAKRSAENASSQKSDFLAKISHEIRTPLNAIIGFSEVMMEERFGAVGSERYKEYLRDIHISGTHIMSLVNDLLDLSKIEAGKLDLSFEAVALNEVMRECVALMQPQANRERIIIRTSLSSSLPAVVADSRSVRQIVLNLLSNAIKFNTAGGQVIVSTIYEDTGEVALRVRDTGPGMSEDDISKALEPFRQLHTARPGRGTGLGLPLTKALVEANRAAFRIDSTVGQGTLVQVTFPSTRVLAE